MGIQKYYSTHTEVKSIVQTEKNVSFHYEEMQGFEEHYCQMSVTGKKTILSKALLFQKS